MNRQKPIEVILAKRKTTNDYKILSLVTSMKKMNEKMVNLELEVKSLKQQIKGIGVHV